MKSKKLLRALSLVAMLGVVACDNPVNIEYKFMLEGTYGQEKTVQIKALEIEEMIVNQKDFAILVSQSTCSGCIAFKSQALNPFIRETNSIIYEIEASIFNDLTFDKAPVDIKVTPTFIIFNSGEEVARVAAGDKKYGDIFEKPESFKEYILSYTYAPKILNIEESQVDSLIAKEKSFILYINWYLCGDCQKLNTRVLDEYKINNIPDGKYIFKLESHKYRSEKPWQSPLTLEQWQAIDKNKDKTEDDYNLELSKWEAWETFATKYHFYDFRYGKIPALTFYENGLFKDYIVYINDEVSKNNDSYTIVNSFYPSINNHVMAIDEYLAFHDNKAKAFLNTYIAKTAL